MAAFSPISLPHEVIYLSSGDDSAEALLTILQQNHAITILPLVKTATHDQPPAVGLVQLTPESTSRLPELTFTMSQFANTAWIALVTRQGLDNHNIKATITECCHDYFTLPLDENGCRQLASSIGHLRGMFHLQKTCHAHDDTVYEMVGTSPVMLTLFKRIRRAASVDAPVLITGESGTGKELIARAIHERSNRSQRAFVAVNCGALPETLVHSELFGYEKGAFTGANTLKMGHIEAANGGTLFLDEIGDLPLDQQVNLLRFLQEQQIRRLGGVRDIPVDVRVIAATHVDLDLAIIEGRFREDLLYRLNVLQLTPPALRERPEDIELLARFFFKRFKPEGSKSIKGFSKKAIIALQQHSWPGNVRELINRVRRALVMCENHLIAPEDLGLLQPENDFPEFAIRSLSEARDEAEKACIRKALSLTGNNFSQASKLLKISRMTLYRLLDKYDLRS